MVAVDGQPPALVPSNLTVTIQAICEWGEFGPKEEDVNTTKARCVVQGVRHGCFETSSLRIEKHITINVDDGASPNTGSKR